MSILTSRYFGCRPGILGRALVPVAAACVVFSIAGIVFMIGPASSHVVLWYALGFEAAGVICYLAALCRRLRRGEAGPVLHVASTLDE